MSDFTNIIYEKKGRIAYVTINRPQRMNAVDPATSRELLQAFSDFRDDDKLWVSILTGAGEKAFSAGADLVAMTQAFAGGEAQFYDTPFGGITRDFHTWKPMIASINGHCLAGGLELTLACDIRVGAGGTQRLPRAIPLAFAMEILLTGGRIDAQTALQWGLVSHVVPLADLMAKAEEIAQAICECGPLAVRAIKQSIYQGLEMTLEEGLALELKLLGDILQTEDVREGPLAFAQKRKPEYKGR
jgi:enoyl-CoA hydratase/carnithine racemase